MASAAEQLAANINFSALAKAEDLKKRIWFTLAALVIYRLGTYIPMPGVDTHELARFAAQNSSGILGWVNGLAGGALGRMAIFALNIMPYISASIIIQLLTTVSPQLEQLKKEGEAGRKKINQYTRYGTVLIAALQAYGISVGLEGQGTIVLDPGLFFRASTVITLTGGTIFLMWLGEQITARGVGNGISLIIFSGIVAGLPNGMAALLELGRTGQMSTFLILAIFVIVLAVVCFIVFPLRISFARPQTTAEFGLLFDALGILDMPFNQAPSLHIATTVILFDLYSRALPRWTLPLTILCALLVGASVLTTYQHHFIDMPTGVLLGLLSVWMWPPEGGNRLASALGMPLRFYK